MDNIDMDRLRNAISELSDVLGNDIINIKITIKDGVFTQLADSFRKDWAKQEASITQFSDLNFEHFITTYKATIQFIKEGDEEK